MKRKCVLNLTTSVDGFIADKDGRRSELLEITQLVGFDEFYKKVDIVLMGRKTYDEAKESSVWPFKGKDVYVITHYLKQKDKNVTFVHENIKETLSALKSQNGGLIWAVGGAQLVDLLMKENLLDAYIVTIAPVLLGGGIRLFKDDNDMRALQLQSVKSVNNCVQAYWTK